MKKQIIRVSPVQSAKVMAVLYLVMSLPFGLLFWLMPNPTGAALPWWMLIVLPVGYMVGGFLFTLIGAWIYNVVASAVGGFEFTTHDVAASD